MSLMFPGFKTLHCVNRQKAVGVGVADGDDGGLVPGEFERAEGNKVALDRRQQLLVQ